MQQHKTFKNKINLQHKYQQQSNYNNILLGKATNLSKYFMLHINSVGPATVPTPLNLSFFMTVFFIPNIIVLVGVLLSYECAIS